MASDFQIDPMKEKRRRCSLCTYESESKGNLQYHLETAHGKLDTSRKLFKCDHCDFSTTFRDRLRPHVYSHSNNQPYECKFSGCNFRSKWKTSLKLHEIRNHAPERHPCSELGCKFIGRHKTSLTNHIANCHKKQFICAFPKCNREFGSETALANHKRLHDPSRPFKCEECHLRFSTKALLVHHTRFIHEEEKHLLCPHCDYRSNRRGSLKYHLRRKHQAEDISCAEPGCNYKSCSPYDMKHHSRRHNDDTRHRFKCEFCRMGYTDSKNLAIHVQRKHETLKQLGRIQERISSTANLHRPWTT